jgi:hypothetical protein
MTGMRQPDTGRAKQCHWCVLLHKKIPPLFADPDLDLESSADTTMHKRMSVRVLRRFPDDGKPAFDDEVTLVTSGLLHVPKYERSSTARIRRRHRPTGQWTATSGTRCGRRELAVIRAVLDANVRAVRPGRPPGQIIEISARRSLRNRHVAGHRGRNLESAGLHDTDAAWRVRIKRQMRHVPCQ